MDTKFQLIPCRHGEDMPGNSNVERKENPDFDVSLGPGRLKSLFSFGVNWKYKGELFYF